MVDDKTRWWHKFVNIVNAVIAVIANVGEHQEISAIMNKVDNEQDAFKLRLKAYEALLKARDKADCIVEMGKDEYKIFERFSTAVKKHLNEKAPFSKERFDNFINEMKKHRDEVKSKHITSKKESSCTLKKLFFGKN